MSSTNNNNNIINEILIKMSQIDFYFENNQQVAKQSDSTLIDTNFLTNAFIKPEQPVVQKRAPGPDRRKLFVGNLAAKTTLQELLDAFGRFGPINESLCVVKDDNYAFIHYYNEVDAERAFKAMNDSYFKNRYIRVQYSTSQGHMKKSKSNTFIFIFYNKNNIKII
jgi:RNA recognition motif-containing protein